MAGLPLGLLVAWLASATVAITTDRAETLPAPPDAAARITLATHVNGAGPFLFTIDTGSVRSVVSDRLARRLSLPGGDTVTIFGITGPQSVTTVRVDRLRIGSRERRAIAAPVLPEEALGAPGFLGIDALRDQSLLLDFRANRVTLARTARDALLNDPDVIVVTGRSRFGQLILTDARVGKAKVYAIIDTGAQNSLGNLRLREVLGRTGPLPADKGAVIGVTGARLPAEPATIPRIRLGGMSVADMPIAYADVQTFRLFGVADKPAILVGMDMLRRFERVAVDFQRREVRFRITSDQLGPAQQDTVKLKGF